MAKFTNALDERLSAFIGEQKLFFVATACASGRINLSPKGMDSFRILAPDRCAVLDLTGSGNETAAHLLADGRITLMWNSFDRNPLILRIYGRGRGIRPDDDGFAPLIGHFPDHPGTRQIFLIDIESIQTSCGFGVPLAADMRERPTLRDWAERKGEAGIRKYQEDNNRRSIDGFETGL